MVDGRNEEQRITKEENRDETILRIQTNAACLHQDTRGASESEDPSQERIVWAGRSFFTCGSVMLCSGERGGWSFR